MNLEHTHGLGCAIVDRKLHSESEKRCHYLRTTVSQARAFQLHHSAPLKHSAQLTEALVCLNTNTKG